MSFNVATWKTGMTQYKVGNKVLPATLLEVRPHEIFRVKTKKTDGYNAICFLAGKERPAKKVSKSVLKSLEKYESSPRELIFEVRISEEVEDYEVEEISERKSVLFDFFTNAIGSAKIDASSPRTVGKGFAGAMQRWNFSGLRASHGVSVSHRSHGSTGQREFPGKVFKGKKMAGHWGSEAATQENLEILFYDTELSLIGVKGSVPGPDSGLVFIRSSMKYYGKPTDSLNSFKLKLQK